MTPTPPPIIQPRELEDSLLLSVRASVPLEIPVAAGVATEVLESTKEELELSNAVDEEAGGSDEEVIGMDVVGGGGIEVVVGTLELELELELDESEAKRAGSDSLKVHRENTFCRKHILAIA